MSPVSRHAEQVFEALRGRRAYRLDELRADPVDPIDIERMLEAANWAPSHRRTEPWRFAVFTGAARARVGAAMAEAYRQIQPADSFVAARHQALIDKSERASVWIALGMQVNPEVPEWEELVAFGCAVHNAWVMGQALGLGCKWTSGAAAVHEHVARVAGFAADVRLRGFLYVGHPLGDSPAGERRPVTEKVIWHDE